MGQAALALITSGYRMRGASRSLRTGGRAPWPESNTSLELDWCLARHQAAECNATRPRAALPWGPAVLGEMRRARARGCGARPRDDKASVELGTGLVSAWDGPRL